MFELKSGWTKKMESVEKTAKNEERKRIEYLMGYLIKKLKE